MHRRTPLKPWRDVLAYVALAAGLVLATGLISGCPAPSTPTGDSDPVFNNPNDPTNGGANYIGSAACAACHTDIYAITQNHGHSRALNRVEGAAPVFPAAGTRAGVPDPPAGRVWTDISYVIGGYTKGAQFVDSAGFRLTTGATGVDTQWNLAFPPNGTVAGFVPYEPDRPEPPPYEYDCFRCHTVNPQPQSVTNPLSQDGRPGIRGTWAEPGVMCEACHGPGSTHAPQPSSRAIFADSSAAMCGRCHTAGDDPNVIQVVDGFVSPNAQYPELLASGGHSTFSCGVCHDPHASTAYDRTRGVRNECVLCHADQNLAFHDGVTFERGEYAEPLTCVSCHMPHTGRQSSSAGPAVVGDLGGRLGDVRGHIFRIDTTRGDFTQMFSADGTYVVKDTQGRAAVTPDFACLRCHNGVGNAFVISADGAAVIGKRMHQNAAGP